MELHTVGKASAPALLLLGAEGMSWEALYASLQPLEKSYYLLLPAFAADEPPAARITALREALAGPFAGRVRAAYGLREGATLLLSLLAEEALLSRVVILEGAFALPETPLPPEHGRIVCWRNAKDKEAKAAWEALHESVTPLSSLTLKKMKAGQDLVDRRPDLMIKQLRKTCGGGVTVSRTAVLPAETEALWAALQERPAEEKALARLTELKPLQYAQGRKTLVLEGSSPHLKLWSHLTRLEPLGEGSTVCTDQVELDAGFLNPLAAPLAKGYLKRAQKQRLKSLKKS